MFSNSILATDNMNATTFFRIKFIKCDCQGADKDSQCLYDSILFEETDIVYRSKCNCSKYYLGL